MPRTWTRRRLLQALATVGLGAGALAGCRALSSRSSDTSSTTGISHPPNNSRPVALEVLDFGPVALPSAKRQFSAQYPRVDLVPIRIGRSNGYWLDLLTGRGSIEGNYAYARLESALRAHNFDPSILIPGSMGVYVHGHHTVALPFAEIPWAVLWRPQAFAAAGLRPPSPEWTFAQFRDACVALKGVAASGRVRGLKGALAPLVTDLQRTRPGRPKGYFFGALGYPGLWQGFVWGFGGTLVSNGRFRITDSGSVAGIGALVDLAREFAVSQADALALGFALWFTLYRPSGTPPGWRWARLPRFPVRPVVPTASVAQSLAYNRHTTPAPAPNSRELLAAVEYLLWWYSTAATSVLIAEGPPPALANPEVQARYWRERTDGAAVVGDWQNFRDCYAGFPWVPDKVVFAALDQVIAGSASLPSALGTAEKQMNDQRYVASLKTPPWYEFMPIIRRL